MEGERVLVIGNGAREHAIGRSLTASPHVKDILFAPGNAGTASIGENLDISASDIEGIVRSAKDMSADLVVVGPEVPLSLGIVDAGVAEGLTLFGPTQKAALLESSKAFMASFCETYHIPQPETKVFKEPAGAISYIAQKGPEHIVIKADGLCAGKGVVLPKSQQEAGWTVQEMMLAPNGPYGDAGKTIVVQERLTGQEVSLMCFSDGKSMVPLISAQDHKRLLDNDKGPNTGGMGAVAPNPHVSRHMLHEISRTIMQPAIAGMQEAGIPFKGVLFAGLMLTEDGPKVLEFNVRFGDPETQSQLMLLKSDLYPILKACTDGTLSSDMVKFRRGAAVGVVLAAEGYPQDPKRGDEIGGLEFLDKYTTIFHGGTKFDEDGNIITNGGRVLTVVGTGSNISVARKRAYAQIGPDGIHFDGMQYRKDIGE